MIIGKSAQWERSSRVGVPILQEEVGFGADGCSCRVRQDLHAPPSRNDMEPAALHQPTHPNATLPEKSPRPRWNHRLRTRLARLVGYNSSMWSGNYPDWNAAQRACCHSLLEGQRRAYEQALTEVLEGRALFERDSLLQHHPVTCWPLLFALRDLQAQGTTTPTVLDFGGGLGSVYFQHRAWWGPNNPIRWNVVELPEIAAVGRRRIDDRQLRFFDSLAEATRDHPPDLILAVGVLPMVPDPDALLVDLASLNARWTHVDRCPVTTQRNHNLITRQVVPRSIYESESPFWFFSHDRLVQQLTTHFEIAGKSTSDFDDPVWVEGCHYEWNGYLLRPRTTPP